MKLNRKRIDLRLPPYLIEELRKHAELRGWTLTQMIEMSALKGLKWYVKEYEKMKNPDEPSKTTLHNSNQDFQERCPCSEDNNNLQELVRIAKAKWVDTD